MSSNPVDKSGKPLDLVLYKFDMCSYCVDVVREAKKLGITLIYRDTLQDPEARDELIAKGGKPQVPCLFVNGTPMYESRDIIHFLETEVAT